MNDSHKLKEAVAGFQPDEVLHFVRVACFPDGSVVAQLEGSDGTVIDLPVHVLLEAAHHVGSLLVDRLRPGESCSTDLT